MTLNPDEMVEQLARDTIWDATPVRRCKVCGFWLSEDAFDKTEQGYLRRQCRDCMRALQRRRYAANRERIRARRKEQYEAGRNDPIEMAARKRRNRERLLARRARAKTDPKAAERERIWRKRYWDRLRSDPERYKAHLENRRITDTLRRRAKGIPAMPERSPLKLVMGGDVDAPRVPVGPFRAWLAQRLRTDEEGMFEARAETMGLHPRTARRILAEGEFVQLDLVDRVLLNEGSTLLVELYPELYRDDSGRAAA